MSNRAGILRRGYAPKRKIRKMIYNGGLTLTNAAQTIELSESTEDETLVRIVGRFHYDFAAVGSGNVFIELWPSGTALHVAIDGTYVADGRDAQANLFSDRFVCSAVNQQDSFPIDVKGMRKLENDDKIVITGAANNAGTGALYFSLTLFFKRA